MAPSAVKTNITELPDSRVRVEAEVDPAEVDRRVNAAAQALGREMRIPGFRKGKVPPPVVLRRVGRGAVLDEAVRESLGSWYAEAITSAGIVTVGDPELNLDDLPSEGEPLHFAIEIGVRPTAKLGNYKALEVGRREPDAPGERIDQEVEQLREKAAKLETVERAAEQGDYVVMDYLGSIDGEPFEGGEGRDQLLELGSGRLIPGFEEQLTGASAGDERAVEVTFPEDYGADHLAGKAASFAVTVGEVKAQVLPELDDDFAADSAGFDTVAELRDDIRAKIVEHETQAIDVEFREAVVDAAAAEATIEVPDALAEARSREMWERMTSTLQRQGISKEMYLQISQKTEEEILAEAKPDAEQALRREAVVAAVAEAESIEPSEEELLEALEHSAEHEKTTPQKLLARLRGADRLDALKEDLAARKAVDFLVEHASTISVESAKAAGKLWTPGADEGAHPPGDGLWTPGS